MGTYDTRGGHPISQDFDDPPISECEEKVGEILEAHDISPHTFDAIMKLIHDDLMAHHAP